MTPPARRVLLATFGSLGDLHPFLAIGRALAERGHHVTVATHSLYAPAVRASRLHFRAVRPDLGRELSDWPARAARYMDAGRGSERVVRELCLPYVEEAYEDTLAAAAGCDLIVSHPLTFAAPIVAEKLRTPWASAALAPLSMFSATDPSVWPSFPWMGALRPFAPGPHRALQTLARAVSARWMEPVARLRKRVGLPRGAHPLFEAQHSPHLVLGLFSPVFAAPQPDWPPAARATGFPYHDRPGAAPSPEPLAAFLEAGEPPIVFTLGTSAVLDARAFFDDAAAAAARLGRRAVLLVGRETGWAPRAPLPEGTLVAEYATFADLFPRAAAIVHQGGIGTTSEALRSGRPMLIVPYAHDQFDNAARSRRLGVAEVLDRARWSAARAHAALARLLGSETHGRRATEVGARIAGETGAENAAAAIERLEVTK